MTVLTDVIALTDGIRLETMNTSMLIDATAPWSLALYIAFAVTLFPDDPSEHSAADTTPRGGRAADGNEIDIVFAHGRL